MSSGHGGVRAYGLVLSSGRAMRPFLAAVVARLPISMAPIGMLLLVQHTLDSYASAGVVSGAFAVGVAAGSPVWGRAMDRLGQARVIAPTVVLSAGLIALLAVSAVNGAGVLPLVALAVAGGATFPPFSAAMRVSWRATLEDPVALRAGYAMDAAAVEAMFVVGPLLLSLLLVVSPPVVPLLITSGLLAGGGLLYCATEPARRPGTGAPVRRERRPAGARPGLRLTTAAALLAVLTAGLAMAIAFGVIDTSLAATARTLLQDEGRLGVLYLAIAGGSTLGGLAYGTTSHRGEHRRMPVLFAVFTVGLTLLALLLAQGRPSLWALLPLLFVIGLTIAPSLIIQQNLVDSLAPAGRLSEAQAWLSTAITTGAAAGTAVAGVLIEAVGVWAAVAGGAGAVAAAVLVATASQRSWAPPAPPPAVAPQHVT